VWKNYFTGIFERWLYPSYTCFIFYLQSSAMSVFVEICKPRPSSPLRLSFIGNASEADGLLIEDDFLTEQIDLNRELMKNPATTFYARVVGNFQESGFLEGDILVVDRSLPLQNKKLAVCCIGGKFSVKRVLLKENGLWLASLDNPFHTTQITEEKQFDIWGLVTYVVKRTW
jgi:DNA polymerase V